MDAECPICMEDLSNTTTRVTTSCCNNILHLECLRKCNYKCPLCRSEIIINVLPPDESTPLTVVLPVSSVQYSLLGRTMFRMLVTVFVVLGVSHYVLMIVTYKTLSPPPPPC